MSCLLGDRTCRPVSRGEKTRSQAGDCHLSCLLFCHRHHLLLFCALCGALSNKHLCRTTRLALSLRCYGLVLVSAFDVALLVFFVDNRRCYSILFIDYCDASLVLQRRTRRAFTGWAWNFLYQNFSNALTVTAILSSLLMLARLVWRVIIVVCL